MSSPIVRRMLESTMKLARRDANEFRILGLGRDEETRTYERAFLRGMLYATGHFESPMYRADIDAFMGARNELNFLFGRYQERT
ncbi:hypothetical protein DFLDMN_001524 [Cupriavidus sp. H19C3]|uniref:hypothetical protein n=1 Tax=Cupriavidus sp. H19C3 TaxID=3241603 RepID=UPI003BF8F4A3